ncbi:hypothetical protein BC938DRAFT_474941 [Jimgerdemannia flammicorona]|uniref:Uncharacterized protein n=1 Tax=Jimgerdemannia flammicorona TaxID=994334 RepID=A0A433Q1A3_9FUNG|nr:hypothetical protein BC938DRAFT_474941 [Jimgerdemannia flammicorona]
MAADVDRAEQSRTEQSRAEQNRAEQSRAEQSKAEQSDQVSLDRKGWWPIRAAPSSSSAMATLAATNKPKENPTGKPSFKKAPPLLPAAYKAIPDDKLQDILWEWNPDLLVETLVVHYKNADTCTRLRSTEHPRFPKRLAEMLHVCSDPPAFVLDFLVSLSTRFSRNDPATSPRFEKLLARMCVEALEKYAYDLAIPEKETEAGATTNEAGEAGMKIDGADPTLSDVDMGIDTMTSLFDITDDIFNNPKTSPNFNIVTRPPTGIITPAHQHRCLSLIPTIASPALIYIAMVPFCLKPLLSAPAADGSEPVGVALIRRLFDHSNHYEAIAAVRALGLGGYFSITQMAVPLLEANNLQQVIVFCEGDEKKTEFLEFVNGQLAILFVGGVKIVPDGRQLMLLCGP